MIVEKKSKLYLTHALVCFICLMIVAIFYLTIEKEGIIKTILVIASVN